MNDADLLMILQESRAYNSQYEITGMLIYLQGRFLTEQEGRFMQVLEGEEDEVREIFEKIKADKRHIHVIPLREGTIDELYFKKWRMGFKSLKLEEYKNIEGFFELDADFLKSNEFQKSNKALNFFRSFYTTSHELDFL